MKLGVFDSGIGGEAIALALSNYFPDADITTINDAAHLPYGDKTRDEIRTLTDAAIQPLFGNDVIVIACNSATAAAIDWLREKYPHQRFIGIEPMIKPAAEQTKTGVVAVCATPATLASTRYNDLKQRYGSDMTILEPDCRSWASMIEENAMNEQILADEIHRVLDNDADIIVLGCTHYHWIKKDILELASGRALVLDPSDAIAARVKTLLAS